MKKILRGICAAIAIAGWCLSANATLTITPPISASASYIVGTAEGEVATVDQGQVLRGIEIANMLISMSVPQTIGAYTTVMGNTDATVAVYNYKAFELSDAQQSIASYYVPAAMYALGKYDQDNAGYILFYLGGEDAYLPTSSANIWVNGQKQGYGLSNVTLFNGNEGYTPVVPEPTTVVAAALLLLPFGASAVRVMRKRD